MFELKNMLSKQVVLQHIKISVLLQTTTEDFIW